MAARRDRIILASASGVRAALLRAAGVEFAIEPAAIDEEPLKREMRRMGETALACALGLAEAKASVVSQRHGDALVIGADQVLAIGCDWFDKPADLVTAEAQLRALRGRTHRLATAVSVAQAGVSVWRFASEPELTMRQFSDAFLSDYIRREGGALLASVGAYRLEGPGIQLFSRISGDHFAILGLPLLELLGFLRECEALLS